MVKYYGIKREMSGDESFVYYHYGDLFEMADWADSCSLSLLIQVSLSEELAETDFDSLIPVGFHYDKEATRKFGEGGFVFTKKWEDMDSEEQEDFYKLPGVVETYMDSSMYIEEGRPIEDWVDEEGVIYIKVLPSDCQ
jgi:hypothetical protein